MTRKIVIERISVCWKIIGLLSMFSFDQTNSTRKTEIVHVIKYPNQHSLQKENLFPLVIAFPLFLRRLIPLMSYTNSSGLYYSPSLRCYCNHFSLHAQTTLQSVFRMRCLNSLEIRASTNTENRSVFILELIRFSNFFFVEISKHNEPKTKE